MELMGWAAIAVLCFELGFQRGKRWSHRQELQAIFEAMIRGQSFMKNGVRVKVVD